MPTAQTSTRSRSTSRKPRKKRGVRTKPIDISSIELDLEPDPDEIRIEVGEQVKNLQVDDVYSDGTRRLARTFVDDGDKRTMFVFPAPQTSIVRGSECTVIIRRVCNVSYRERHVIAELVE